MTDSDHLADFRQLLDELNAESPRGGVMVACATLDDLLAKTIAARLIDDANAGKLLDGFNAPLGSFSSRIVAAFALGVVSRLEFDDLQVIRKIRNDFAHRAGVSFADPSIKDKAMTLKMAAQDYGIVIVPPAGRFTTAAVALILNLTNRPYYVSQKRLVTEEWPY